MCQNVIAEPEARSSVTASQPGVELFFAIQDGDSDQSRPSELWTSAPAGPPLFYILPRNRSSVTRPNNLEHHRASSQSTGLTEEVTDHIPASDTPAHRHGKPGSGQQNHIYPHFPNHRDRGYSVKRKEAFPVRTSRLAADIEDASMGTQIVNYASR